MKKQEPVFVTKFTSAILFVLIPVGECPLNGDDFLDSVWSKSSAIVLMERETAADLELKERKACRNKVIRMWEPCCSPEAL